MRTGHRARVKGLLFGCLFFACVIPPAYSRLMTAEEARIEDKQRAREMEIIRQSNNANHTNDAPTLAKIGKIVLTGANWNGTDIRSVLMDLQARTGEADPDHAGIRFSLQFPTDPNKPDVLGRLASRRIYIILQSRQPLPWLLGDICEQTNLAYKVRKNEVIFLQWEPDAFFAPDSYLFNE